MCERERVRESVIERVCEREITINLKSLKMQLWFEFRIQRILSVHFFQLRSIFEGMLWHSGLIHSNHRNVKGSNPVC